MSVISQVNQSNFEKNLEKEGYIRCRHQRKNEGGISIVKCSDGDYNLNHDFADSVYFYVPMKADCYMKLVNGKELKTGFTKEDDELIVVYGYNEQNKPPTLIQPRPTIRIKSVYNCLGLFVDRVLTQYEDDAVIYAIHKTPFKKFFDAMHNKEKVLEFEIGI